MKIVCKGDEKTEDYGKIKNKNTTTLRKRKTTKKRNMKTKSYEC